MAFHLIKRNDGGVSILITTSDDIKPEDEVAKWSAERQAAVLSVHPLDASVIPTDRYFRNAWVHQPNDARIYTSMSKARDIHKDVLRHMRDPLLAALDVDYQRADEASDTTLKATIAAKKQALRDVTADPRIAAAQTPSELKAVMPDALVGTTKH